MNTTAPPVRIIVADDHEVVRSGFASLLDTQPDFTVVGTVADGFEAVRIDRELQPDVILMDIRMPGMDGIQATRQLASQRTDRPRILVLTTFDLDEYVYDALRAGASGFLLKDVTAERLFEAVRVIAAGDALLAPGVTADSSASSPNVRRPNGNRSWRSRSSPRAKQKSCSSSPRAYRTPRSPADSWSLTRRSRRMSATSSTNSDCATAPKPSSQPTKPDSSYRVPPAQGLEDTRWGDSTRLAPQSSAVCLRSISSSAL
jgi:DNA-binding NarL/FixJ family response regulator